MNNKIKTKTKTKTKINMYMLSDTHHSVLLKDPDEFLLT
jgi:hypothetical protein